MVGALAAPPRALRAWPAILRASSGTTAASTFLLVWITGVGLGLVVIAQARLQAARFGATELVASLFATGLVREGGPALVAVLAIGRSGSALAARLAVARARGEVDAADAAGVDPVHLLVWPHVVEAGISVACLTIHLAVVAVLAGAVGSRLLFDLPVGAFLRLLAAGASTGDVAVMLAEGALFGAGSTVLCCHAVLAADDRGSRALPRSVSRAVVRSLAFVLASAAALTLLRVA